MTDLHSVRGFDDLWAPVGGRRVSDAAVLGSGQGGRGEVKARLARVVARAPEVMVKITGKTRDAAHLQAHLAYITRDGSLVLEGRDGERLQGLRAVRELGADWAAEDLRRRKDASLSLSVVLSMPPGTDELRMRDAARAFALETFAERFDYAFALHTDAGHPHVHLSIRSLGEDGRRLNPRKADLEEWRATFARRCANAGSPLKRR
jgi:type IV secretory pathway VirD2 relaxase